MVDLKELEDNHIIRLIREHPDIIEYVKDRLNNFPSIDIYDIIMDYPELIHYFKNKIPDFEEGLNDFNLASFVNDNPQYLKMFKKRIDNIFSNRLKVSEYPTLNKIYTNG